MPFHSEPGQTNHFFVATFWSNQRTDWRVYVSDRTGKKIVVRKQPDNDSEKYWQNYQGNYRHQRIRKLVLEKKEKNLEKFRWERSYVHRGFSKTVTTVLFGWGLGDCWGKTLPIISIKRNLNKLFTAQNKENTINWIIC